MTRKLHPIFAPFVAVLLFWIAVFFAVSARAQDSTATNVIVDNQRSMAQIDGWCFNVTSTQTGNLFDPTNTTYVPTRWRSLLRLSQIRWVTLKMVGSNPVCARVGDDADDVVCNPTSASEFSSMPFLSAGDSWSYLTRHKPQSGTTPGTIAPLHLVAASTDSVVCVTVGF